MATMAAAASLAAASTSATFSQVSLKRSAKPAATGGNGLKGLALAPSVRRMPARLSVKATSRIVMSTRSAESVSDPSQKHPTGALSEEPSDASHPDNHPKDGKLSVKDLDEIQGKAVFVRADLNVPLDGDGNITDDTRIRASLPTIQYLIDNGARIVLASHLGRPKSGPEPKYSLKPVAKRLEELLKKPVIAANDSVGPEVEEQIKSLKNGEVLLLENVRFYKEEEKNNVEHAKKLAAGINYFVNDAFGSAHRAHASTAGIAPYTEARVAGFLLQKELAFLQTAVARPTRPFVAIVGGSKVSSKIGVIESLLEKCDTIILGGGMIFTFYKAKGMKVGNSLVEDDKIDLAKSLMEQAAKKGVALELPVDVVCADKFDAAANTQTVSVDNIPDGWMGLDVGPESVKVFKNILKDAKTVLWNGPMGVFEFEKFSNGTFAIAKSLAEITKTGATTIIGGGDSVAAVEKAGVAGDVTHISTGGGASLELLEGKILPGVAVLDDVRIHA
eukprot:jgi/Chlat1/4322/Chrsp29S04482